MKVENLYKANFYSDFDSTSSFFVASIDTYKICDNNRYTLYIICWYS